MDNIRKEYNTWLVQLSNDEIQQLCEESAWIAWQASRAALVVEFTAEAYFSPCKTDLELAHDDGFNSAMSSVKAALDMVGVKYE